MRNRDLSLQESCSGLAIQSSLKFLVIVGGARLSGVHQQNLFEIGFSR
jgi:hypothetical protein